VRCLGLSCMRVLRVLAVLEKFERIKVYWSFKYHIDTVIQG
jgi:hypothetical protein